MMRRRVRLILLLIATTVLAACAGVVIAWRREAESLPKPGSRIYREMVSAFYTGTAALDSDAEPLIARNSLIAATKLVPREPASWANLALLKIRQNNLEAAAKDLEKAIELAPNNAKVRHIAALLEEHKGKYADSVAQLKTAIGLDPRDLYARYDLAKQLDRLEGNGAAEAFEQFREIRKMQPNNLVVLGESVRLAAKIGDLDAVGEVLGRLKDLSKTWPVAALKPLSNLERAVSSKNLDGTTLPIAILNNQLKLLPDYQAGLAVVQPTKGHVGQPIERFLALESPSPTPAPADMEMRFTIAPLGTPPAGSISTIAAVISAEGGPPRFFAADASQVRSLDGNAVAFPYPGGPAKVAPSPDGLLAIDWDSDYLIDLVLAGAGGLRFLKQSPEGTFTDATGATGLPPELIARDLIAVWAADIDQDGDLDLIAGPRSEAAFVIQNQGAGKFAATRPFDSAAGPRGFLWVDLDREGTPDLVFLDKSNRVHVFINERAGKYREDTTADVLGPAIGITAADLNHDGVMQILAMRGDGTIASLSPDPEGGPWKVEPIAKWAGTPPDAARLFAADLDNNGGLDLVASGPQGSQIWLADEANRLKPSSRAEIQVATIVDVNADGRLDLAGLNMKLEPIIASNRGLKTYRWQILRPRASRNLFGDGRINSFGVGGLAEIRAGLVVQSQPIVGPEVHFGLGDHPGADVTRILWPNGEAQVEFRQKPDQATVTEQRLKGSCPFVYAFNGEKIEFVTDFLWRSPLGLRINAQDTAGSSQTEDWIKIRGDQLAPRDGHYDIRLTAELWETHYWDHVSLMVVDHPADTEVFVDERFARVPPALMIHRVSTLRPVAKAVDDQGHDAGELLSKRDGLYLDNFGRGIYQGVTRDHFVEVEIGDDLPHDRKLWLVANGWIHPTDSSINVAIAQGRQPKPRGLSLEVATKEGGWSVARDDLGFPAGKNKTILIDLEGVFPPGAPRRLRLRTNLEIFWDSLALAEDRGVVTPARLLPDAAMLRPRGYSLLDRKDDSSPEVPHYEILTGTGQKWRDLIGHYTRFGDVRELLEKVDDRYVIANAGDEVAFRFPAPPPPAQGLARDFVLVGDGWNKDGDFNTASSKGVLPLPSHDNPAYDATPGALEDDPVYRRHSKDWEDFHTRYINTKNFRDAIRPGSSIGDRR